MTDRDEDPLDDFAIRASKHAADSIHLVVCLSHITGRSAFAPATIVVMELPLIEVHQLKQATNRSV